MNNSKPQDIPFPQEPLWKETLDVLHEAENVDVLIDPKALEQILHFNSKETRTRYGRAIATRFARLEGPILRGLFDISKFRFDRATIEAIWRILFCMVEPVVSKAYLEIIWPREPGSIITRNEIRSYVETTFKHESRKLNTRLVNCLRQGGYVLPQGKDNLIVVGFGELEEPLVLATHLLFAKTPKTLKLSEIEASNYWRFLGYRKLSHVKVGFRSAEAKGIIERYAIVDHLEQITTRFSWEELLSKGKWNK
jgi:hypothetical protein